MVNNSAHQKLETVKPEIIFDAIHTISALITNKNKPSVMMVAGIVRKINNGRTKIFNNPITTATIIASQNVSTCTPGSKYAAIKTVTLLKSNFISKLIFKIFQLQNSTKKYELYRF
jgi:hypothetical protein